jgi:hypothetical protein
MMQRKSIFILLMAFMISLPAGLCDADQVIIAHRVDTDPVVDGIGDDIAWSKANAITTHDPIAGIDIQIKAVIKGNAIFILVTFPDKNESREHKPWIWNQDAEMYTMGPDREDVLVLKWNMEPGWKDLSVYADKPYRADIWFWKACRTDPSGYADDKIQWLHETPIVSAKKLQSMSGKTTYLVRKGDVGKPAYSNVILTDFQHPREPQFVPRQPTGSRADISAKGKWANDQWTIEFRRRLITGQEDDIQLTPGKHYQLGVSRYEIAGRPADSSLSQPLYGSGDVSETIYLEIEQTLNLSPEFRKQR